MLAELAASSGLAAEEVTRHPRDVVTAWQCARDAAGHQHVWLGRRVRGRPHAGLPPLEWDVAEPGGAPGLTARRGAVELSHGVLVTASTAAWPMLGPGLKPRREYGPRRPCTGEAVDVWLAGAPVTARGEPGAPCWTSRRRGKATRGVGSNPVRGGLVSLGADQLWLGDPHASRPVPPGSNPGSKLSATESNSEQLRPPQSAESHRVRLDRSGWGPGGRRFKSCLPDHGKALLIGLLCRAVAASGRGTTGKIFDGIRRRRAAPLGSSAYPEGSTRGWRGYGSALHPVRNRVVAGATAPSEVRAVGGFEPSRS